MKFILGQLIMIDKIGRSRIVGKMIYLIETLSPNRNFCLSLNGTWGSGKSVVLELLRERLLQHPEYIVVHYDAWKNSFYSDPLIAMLYCILDTLENSVSEEVLDTITSKRMKQTALKVAATVGEAVVDTIAEKSLFVKFIKGAIEKVKGVIRTYKETSFTNNPEVEDFKSYSSFLNETIKQLNEITAQTVIENKQTKLVILVDEIDRCLPNEQLIVLERLHHLFDVHNCAVIVALNKGAIRSNFEKNYGGNGEDYLRKFFQYNFELSTDAVVLLKNRLTDLFYEINDKREEVIIEKGVDFIIEDIVSVATDIIKTKKIDNRDIEKYINDSSSILRSIVNYHPALIWFTLRVLLYRMFNDDLYNKILDEKKTDSILIINLNGFLGIKNAPSGFIETYIYQGRNQSIRYSTYTENEYNDLLFLFNVCRFRYNENMVNVFVQVVNNTTFYKYRNSKKCKELIEQIKAILFEMERYGNV